MSAQKGHNGTETGRYLHSSVSGGFSFFSGEERGGRGSK